MRRWWPPGAWSRCPRRPTCSCARAPDGSTGPSRCSTTWPMTASPMPTTARAWGSPPSSTTPSFGVTREEQDHVAALSHHAPPRPRARASSAEEIVPVEVPQRRGDAARGDPAEAGIRPETTPVTLAALRPAFAEGGSVTRRLIPAADLRRRGGAAAHHPLARRAGGMAGAGLARGPGARDGRAGAGQLPAGAAGRRDRPGAGEARASPPPLWTSWRSTGLFGAVVAHSQRALGLPEEMR